MEDITKLPKWAQQRIQLLEETCNDFEAKLAQFEGRAETNVFLQSYDARMPQWKPLPKDAEVKFVFMGEWVTCQIRDNKLQVYGSRGLSIQPIVTNRLDINVIG